MAEKKSILEEALLDIKIIESALNANTREILRSVAREEIDSVVKKSLSEGYEEEDLDATDNLGADADAATTHVDGDMELEDDLEDIQGSEEVAPEMEPEMGMDADALGGEEMDMTQASDDDVIAIYKKLSGEDEIEIVGDEIHLTVSEPGEYVIKAPTESAEPEMGMGAEDDIDYEIELGNEEDGPAPDDLVPVDDSEDTSDDTTSEVSPEEEEGTEEPIEEKIAVGIGRAVGNHRNPHTSGSIGAPENPKSKLDESAKNLVLETKKYNMLLTEAKKLKSENEEFRGALKQFRNKLVETVLFNSNLTYATMLFSDYSTTKSEKQNILKRFDEVGSIKESKKLFKTIENELSTRKPITEAVASKVTKEVTSGTSKQLNESTAYVDPSTKRIIDLMRRVENK